MAAGDLITRDRQIEWRGTLLGSGTPYRLVNLEGWLDRPEMRDGDIDRDNQHGAHPGQLLVGRRTITATYRIVHPLPEFRSAVAELQRVTAPDENPVEEPLVIQWDGAKALVWARCTGVIVPTGRRYAVGVTEGVVRWRATNPRRLRLPQLSPSTSPAQPPSGGLVFPLMFPLAFSAGRAGGELALTNEGGAHAQPVWRITGPAPGARITNLGTGQRLWLADTFTVPAGQQLDLTTEDRTVGFVSSGVSRSSELVRREWFTLPPGAATGVRFETLTGSGQLTCLYHHTDL
ncbi:phage tail family protein [Actinophytocola sediminis]